MFYIFEILKRLNYFFFSYLFLFCIIYLNYNTFFSGLNYLFKKIFNEPELLTPNYYIYTHPFELYYTQLYFCLTVSFYIIFPYFLWQILDFCKPSLYFTEYLILHKTFLKGLWIFNVIYFLLYLFVIPISLEILQTVKQTYNSTFFTVFFELKVQDFINFIFYLNAIVSISILFLLLLNFFIFQIQLSKILTNKKFLYLIALVFSTFITPPDIFSQIFLLCLIICSLEFIILLRLIIYFKK